MHFAAVVLAFALLSSPSAFANPLPLEGRSMTEIDHAFKRQSANRICGDKNFYSASFQSQTFQFASQTNDAIGVTVKGTNDEDYPHEFRNDEKIAFPDCPGVPGPYREFPIRQGGLLFTDGVDPGMDRIIYKVTGTSPATGFPDNFAYCGVITHIGAPRGKFVTCYNV